MIKKFTAWVLALSMLMGMTVTVFAAEVEELGTTDFYSEVSGKSRTVTKRVEERRNTYRITGLYYPDQAKEVFRLMNIERAAAGLPKLKWEEDLVQPAIQRALEQYVEKSHTRPNGKDGLTVSSLAHGENLAGGDINAADVMEGWMDSPGHKSNILDTDFTSVAVACVETDQMCFWVQLFHAEKKTSSSSQSASSESKDSGVSSGSDAAKSAIAALNKAKASGQNASAVLKNTESLSPADFKEIFNWGTANNKTVSLTVDTTVESGKSVQGRMTLYPANFIARTSALKLGVRVDKEATSSMLNNFNKWYKNNVALIRLEQNGDLGANVNIAAKADLTGLDTKNLIFYSYNPSTKKMVKLAAGKGDYSIDKNKYLRFATNKGGYIVVTDKELEKR